MEPQHEHASSRATLLALMLSLFALGGMLLFLIFASGGFFLYVVLGCGAIAGVALVHYLLWGGEMQRDTEGEREEERWRDETEASKWN
jgi:hypothetical protein